MVGFYSLQVSQRQNNAKATFGYHRMEVVGALMNGTFLLSVCFNISLEAIHRFGELDEVYETLGSEGDRLLIVAVLGLVVNILGLFIFSGSGHGHSHGGGHGHSHGHSHSKKSKTGDADGETKKRNLNMEGVFLHVLGDALGSVGVIISGLVIKYGPESWGIYRVLVDPLCSLIIVLIILVGTIPLVKTCISILLQKSPKDVDVRAMHEQLETIGAVEGVHDIHVWGINAEKFVGTAHIVLNESCTTSEISAAIDTAKLIMHGFGVHATTVQPEVLSLDDIDSSLGKIGCNEPICNDAVDCISKSCCPPNGEVTLSSEASQRKMSQDDTNETGHDHSGHGHSHD
jgi:zinc transporter 1